MMKNYVWIACLIMITLSGCAKKEQGCTPVSPASEEAQILKYAADNGITAMKHSSGMYYQIINQGMGTTPTINSKVSATYTGKLLDGTIFDSSTADFPLSQVIEGWQIGIPLISKGGRIKLIIPSSYGYGCNAVKKPNTEIIVIPGNSVLYFDISLIDVK